MRLHCPICGWRPSAEFTYGGADLPRPAADAAQEVWDAHTYLRDNPAGPHAELWFHAASCRRWIALVRDTRTGDLVSEGTP